MRQDFAQLDSPACPLQEEWMHRQCRLWLWSLLESRAGGLSLLLLLAQAAIMRAGLNEMRDLAEAIYPTVRDGTFFESCGVADLIATCYGAAVASSASTHVCPTCAGHFMP
jgi:hypothetical protein